MSLLYFASLVLLIILMNLEVITPSFFSRNKDFNLPQQDLNLDEPKSLEELRRTEPQIFEDLMEDKPELRMMLKMRRKNKSQEVFEFPPPPLPPVGTEDDYEDEDLAYAIRMQRSINGNSERWWLKDKSSWNKIASLFPIKNETRRFQYHESQIRQIHNFLKSQGMFKGPLTSKCFECGNIDGIPRSRLCHDAFDSPDGKARTMQRYFRVYCHCQNMNWEHWKKKIYWPESHRFNPFLGHPNPLVWREISTSRPFRQRGPISDYRYLHDHGNPFHDYYRGYCYNSKSVCVKRFLDIGGIYTQRGCKSWPPIFLQKRGWRTGYMFVARHTGNFATHRFKKLETIFGENVKKDECIYSPAASLTPFARGISLFARYHVCVCLGDYCNNAYAGIPNITLIFLAFLGVIYFYS